MSKDGEECARRFFFVIKELYFSFQHSSICLSVSYPQPPWFSVTFGCPAISNSMSGSELKRATYESLNRRRNCEWSSRTKILFGRWKSGRGETEKQINFANTVPLKSAVVSKQKSMSVIFLRQPVKKTNQFFQTQSFDWTQRPTNFYLMHCAQIRSYVFFMKLKTIYSRL